MQQCDNNLRNKKSIATRFTIKNDADCTSLIRGNTQSKYIKSKPQTNQIISMIKKQAPHFFSSLEQNSHNKINNKKLRVLFSKEEDEKIKFLVDIYGTKQWGIISSFLNGRTPKQCRDRYKNYLEPGFFSGQWTNEEDNLLKKLYEQNGPKWSILSKSFIDRSPGAIKNRWKYFLCRQKSDSSANDNSNEFKKIDFFLNKNDCESSQKVKTTTLELPKNNSEKSLNDILFDNNSEFFDLPDQNIFGDWNIFF